MSSETAVSDKAKFGAVAIGRNEGERLKQCLTSLSEALFVVYVDSGSSDGSVEWARERGVEAVKLDMRSPFTAARARNAGFRRLRELAPNLAYVQFVDGDCELDPKWPQKAVAYLNSRSDIGAVCGRRRERFPERSIYNLLFDRGWDRPAGEARAFGGDVMMRAAALEAIGGYRDDVIAGEEPELCVRLRAAGWHAWRLDSEMTVHDAAIHRFDQWWRRTLRSGYAFALGAHLHGAPPERHFVWESRRAQVWGLWLPLACLTASACLWPWGTFAWLIYPLQILRQTARNTGPLQQRATLAFFQLLGRFPEALGQIKFMNDRLFGRRSQLIEYK
jgi:GT2 family glycosyltransferase